MIKLKQYQERAVEKLRAEINELVDYSDSKVCIFKAPTGSGKTIMIAEFLKRFVTNRADDKTFAFIWIAVNKLHSQSKDKLEKYFEDTRTLHCSSFDDLEETRINENEILFFNWQSINKKENLYIRENEYDNNLNNIIENTKEAGREVILIIDESHHTAKAEKSREVIDSIIPNTTIEVSATPQITNVSRIVEVDFEDVKNEGMIKREIAINPSIDEIEIGDKSTDEFIIDCALTTRNRLKQLHEKEGSNVNPLLLIQLPDNRKGVKDKKDDIISILEKKDITIDNRKLAIYLSEKDSKINLENIEKPGNETEVMIFKQAIALGWDCPRASILVLFRDWKSITFSIQTIGRIMRMPEFKHYESDELNKGYVFTNLSDISIAEDISKDYLTVYESKRDNKTYQKINLNSIYLKRQRERTRLSSSFSKIFYEIAMKDGLHKKISFKSSSLVNELMIDGKIVKLDQAQMVEHEGELTIKLKPEELQNRFDLYTLSVCSPFAPADSSGRIKTALYKFFEQAMKVENYYKVQQLVLSENNRQLITDSINKAKEQYRLKVIEELADDKEVLNSVWNVPNYISYNSKYELIRYSKSIMKPYYALKHSTPELQFIELLDNKNNDVLWWYKNGENESKYLAIKYSDEKGILHSFYPDFVVYMKDGSIGIFDTKKGRTAEDAKDKAEALQAYIKRQNDKFNKKLWGGIVVFENDSCRLNDNSKYEFDNKDLSNWKFLTFKGGR